MAKYILTVTVNPALDLTALIDQKNFGKSTEYRSITQSAGGKGFNVSRTLRSLGVATKALGVAGQSTGAALRRLLREEEIPFDLVECASPTRINITVLNRKYEQMFRLLGAGSRLSFLEKRKLLSEYQRLLKGAGAVIISGRNAPNLSDDFYASLIRQARKRKVPVALDSSGQSFKKALLAKPLIIKPNQEEAEQVLGYKIADMKKAVTAVADFHQRGVSIVLLTLGQKGAFGFDGRTCWQVLPNHVKMKNDVGCGDAFLAGFVAGMMQRKSFDTSLKMAAACAGASGESLVAGQLTKKIYLKYFKSVHMKKIF